jgi:lipid-A-disaccharide synthase
MNILIICGESSSNSYGTALAETLQAQGHRVFSFGNNQLETVSEQLMAIDTTKHSVSFGQWRKKHQLINRMKHAIHASPSPIDKAVIIDFPNYNFKIAALLKHFNIPITTFITPNFWIWGQRRLAKKILDYSNAVITIFKKEYDLYSGINKHKTYYFGHPLSQCVSLKNSIPTDRIRIGLFPGSRNGEIKLHLPAMLQVLSLINIPNLSVTIYCEDHQLHPQITAILNSHNVTNIQIKSEHRDLSLAITAPGTNSLKLALMRIPMTIIGYLNPWVYVIAKYILRLQVPFIGLPNIILDRTAFPEYIQPSTQRFKDIAKDIMTLLMTPEYADQFDPAFDQIQHDVTSNNSIYTQIAATITNGLN